MKRWVTRSMLASLSATACMVALTPFELWLRHDARYANYFELNGLSNPGHYTESLVEPYLHVHKSRSLVRVEKTEFTVEFTTNAEGLLGPDVTVTKAADEVRIIALGDSFTQGIGADNSHSYPALLGQLLAARPGPTTYTVMNAGVSGSDPVFELKLLERKLLKYQPDLVILAINSSDLADLKRLGGIDRFDANGKLQARQWPWWTKLFDSSHLVRAFVLGIQDYDWDLRTPAESAARTGQAVRELVETGVRAQRLAAAEGFTLLIVVHPTWRDVQSGAHIPELVEVLSGLAEANVSHADLLPYFKAAIPRPVPADYYWPIDAHFTAKGYQVFADAVYARICGGSAECLACASCS